MTLWYVSYLHHSHTYFGALVCVCRTTGYDTYVFFNQIINIAIADGIIKVYANVGNEIFSIILYDKSDIAVQTDEYKVTAG